MNDLSVDIDNPDCYGEIKIPIVNKETNEDLGQINVRWSKIPALFAVRNPEDSGFETVEKLILTAKTTMNVENEFTKVESNQAKITV